MCSDGFRIMLNISGYISGVGNAPRALDGLALGLLRAVKSRCDCPASWRGECYSSGSDHLVHTGLHYARPGYSC